jgi:hypothetical protein
MANITVKKNDGTTDITYTAVVPSSGDTVQAVWKSQTVGTAPSHQPEFKLSSRDASGGTKRSLHSVLTYPQIATDSTTTLTTVVNRISVSSDWTIPKDMSQTDINEAVSQYANLLASTLIKDSAKGGYAPT